MEQLRPGCVHAYLTLPYTPMPHVRSYISRPRSRSSPACRASLRQQQQHLTRQLAEVLQRAQATETSQIQAAIKLVHQGVAVLVASPDWHQLQQTCRDAARQQLAAARAAAATPGMPGQPIAQSTTNQSHSVSTAGRPTTGSSPWGFALRQPSKHTLPARPQSAAAGVTASADRLLPGSQQQEWDWAAVQQLVVLGTGSIGKLRANSPGASSLAAPSSRLGFRFFQLVLAKALQETLLPGLTSPPAAFDPDFEPFDHELLGALGFQVLTQEPHHTIAAGIQTLLYMPCCPRELYGVVLAANNGRLQQLAVLGTSLASLADTQALVEALTSPPEAATTTTQPTDSPAGGTCRPASSAPRRQQPNATEPGKLSLSASAKSSSTTSTASVSAGDGCSAGGGGGNKQGDFLQLAYQQACVVEVPCPDCAAHGVGVALHLFCKPAVLLA